MLKSAFLAIRERINESVSLSVNTGERWDGERGGDRRGWESGESRDVHKEIKDAIFHESFHVPVRLPSLCRFIHGKRLF